MTLFVSSPFARDLVRLLASWVAVIVFVQTTASAVGGVQGPRHVHVRSAEAAVFVHAAPDHAPDAAHEAEHHEHGGWARHVHPVASADTATLSDEAQDLGAAAGLVLSALVALGPVHSGLRIADAAHVMRASPAWSCITHAMPFPDRPPRA